MGSKKFLFTIISLVILVSSLSSVSFIHSVFAQDEGATFTGHIKLSPNEGPPGTGFTIYGTGFSVGSTALVMSPWDHGTEVAIDDHEFSTFTEVSPDAQPGTYTITATTINGEASATFTVVGKKIPPPTPPTPTAKGTGTPNPPPPPPPPPPPGKTAVGTGNTPTSGAVSSNPTNPPPPPPPPPKPPKSSHPITKSPGSNSGASFQVIKKVVGGNDDPTAFNFNIILTGPSGTAQYSLELEWGTGDAAGSGYYLNLPKGNTLSEGNYQIVETNPMGYTPTYSKGCSGAYDNDGYTYTCSVTNTKKVIPSTTSVTRNGPPPPLPGIPKGTGKSTLPNVSNTGKLTLPTTPSKGTGKLTLPTTPGKSTGPIIPKPPVVHSCPAGSIVANGKCVAKGKVVGTLQ